MRRVLVLTTSFPRHDSDDAGIFVARLLKAAAQQGCAGEVIVPADIEPETLHTLETFPIYRVRYGLFSQGRLAFGSGIMPNIRRSPQLLLQAPALLIRMAQEACTRASHDSVLWAHWIVSGVAAWIVWVIKGNPYLITVRGEDFKLLKLPLLGWLLRQVLKQAKALVTVNQEFADKLRSEPGIHPDRVHTIENGCDAPGTTAPLPADLQRPFLVSIGTVIPRKRLELALTLLAQPELLKYTLVICGRTSDEKTVQQLKNQAAKLGISDRVRFEGGVAPERIGDYLREAAACISTSAFEGRPNALLEALSAGALVVASDISAHREIISDGENGLLFSDQNIPAAAQRLAQTLQNPELSSRLRDTAIERVREFTWARAAEQYLKLLVAA